MLVLLMRHDFDSVRPFGLSCLAFACAQLLQGPLFECLPCACDVGPRSWLLLLISFQESHDSVATENLHHMLCLLTNGGAHRAAGCSWVDDCGL